MPGAPLRKGQLIENAIIWGVNPVMSGRRDLWTQAMSRENSWGTSVAAVDGEKEDRTTYCLTSLSLTVPEMERHHEVWVEQGPDLIHVLNCDFEYWIMKTASPRETEVWGVRDEEKLGISIQSLIWVALNCHGEAYGNGIIWRAHWKSILIMWY